MLFNSFTNFFFVVILFFAYWYPLRRSLKGQNLLLLVASYVFYGWWDWRFLSLMFASSLLDFYAGIRIQEARNDAERKLFLLVSLAGNLGMLGFFKYYNFFIDSFLVVLGKIGFSPNVSTLEIILPVGISFYTFQTMSYSIDIYRKQLVPTRDPIAFFAFVSFFPQLVAGPIERASALLPQFLKSRVFDREYAKEGMRQILWGLIKKVVIADTLALDVDRIFNPITFESAPALILIAGAILFSFQLYCDFSGYSDMAIGSAKLFGFRLMQNFAYPFFSRNIGELWQRWHISLSTWFKDYVFIPLGGSRGSRWHQARNITATFILSGFWHGANWTFLIWGALHALFYMPLIFAQSKPKFNEAVAATRFLPNIRELFQMAGTFGLFAFSMIFFRAENVSHSMQYITSIYNNWHDWSDVRALGAIKWSLSLIILLVLLEWSQRKKQHVMEIGKMPVQWRWGFYLLAMAAFMYYGQFDAPQSFIYFQF